MGKPGRETAQGREPLSIGGVKKGKASVYGMGGSEKRKQNKETKDVLRQRDEKWYTTM
jgi:hypothetical protein